MKNKRNNVIWKVLAIIFAVGFIVSLTVFGVQKYEQKKAEDEYRQLAEQHVTEEVQEESVAETESDILAELGIKVPDKQIDFVALKEENEDIYAWIYVPGTNVDYPVLQHPTDDTYYLEHNIDGSAGLPGCIYTESVNKKDFLDPHTVIYGHNMKNGSMFASLHSFEDKEFFEENKYIFIYTEDKTYVYEIFAAYKYNAIHLIYNFDLNNPDIFQNYLDQIFEIRDMGANIRQDVEVNADDHIVTLSTCISGQKNMRYLVQGVLLNEEG